MLQESARRVTAAARGLAREGSDVRFLTGIFVPEDEVGLCLFEAGSRDAVVEACRRGGLLFDRILEVNVIGSAVRQRLELGPSTPGREEVRGEPLNGAG